MPLSATVRAAAPRRLRSPSSLLALGLAAVVLAALPGADALAARKHAKRVVPEADAPAYGEREDVRLFAAEVAERRDLDRAWVQQLLSRARRVPAVARLIMPPPAGTAKNWAAYRARFVEPDRIAAGLGFWRANADALQRAQERFGVPPEIIVGIVGVETYYGRILGNFRTLDALATLAFDFPSGRRDRSAFFREELEQLLLWCHRERCDLPSVRGSYAGAVGLPQFMPGSLNRHGLDFDGDGHVDLMNATDVVGSVANYLAAFGWQRGMPTHYPVAAPVDASDRAALLAPDIVPSFSAGEFADKGAVLGEPARNHLGPLALVELQNGDAAPSYVAGTQNFYAVTRYNWSSYYAMAVIELGAAVARERDRPR